MHQDPFFTDILLHALHRATFALGLCWRVPEQPFEFSREDGKECIRDSFRFDNAGEWLRFEAFASAADAEVPQVRVRVGLSATHLQESEALAIANRVNPRGLAPVYFDAEAAELVVQHAIVFTGYHDTPSTEVDPAFTLCQKEGTLNMLVAAFAAVQACVHEVWPERVPRREQLQRVDRPPPDVGPCRFPHALHLQQVVKMTEDDWEGRHVLQLTSGDPKQVELAICSIAYWAAHDGHPAVLGLSDAALAFSASIQRSLDGVSMWTPALAKPAPFVIEYIVAALSAEDRRLISRAVHAVLVPEEYVPYGDRTRDALSSAGHPWRRLVPVDAEDERAYTRWCSLCQRRATEMNAHGVALAGWNYRGMPALRRPWRAVDVQRAFSEVADVCILGDPTNVEKMV